MIDTHIATLMKKASGIEKRLFETDEKLEVAQILKLCTEMDQLIGCAQQLTHIKNVRTEQDRKIIAPPSGLVKV